MVLESTILQKTSLIHVIASWKEGHNRFGGEYVLQDTREGKLCP